MKARLPQGMGGGGAANLQQLARQAQKMQEQMEQITTELEAKEYTAAAGGGAAETVRRTVSAGEARWPRLCRGGLRPVRQGPAPCASYHKGGQQTMSYEINFGPWGSIFAVPTAVADRYLKFCTEEQLKVLLLALRQGQGPVDTAGIAARLGMDEAAVTDCLQYWQESGLFTESQNPQPAKEAPKAPENNESAVVKTIENGITTIRSRGHLSPGEINTMLREDKPFAALAAELDAGE